MYLLRKKSVLMLVFVRKAWTHGFDVNKSTIYSIVVVRKESPSLVVDSWLPKIYRAWD